MLPVVYLRALDPLSLCSPSGQTRIQFIKHFDFRADSKQKKFSSETQKIRRPSSEEQRNRNAPGYSWRRQPFNKVNKISDRATSEAHQKNYSHFLISQLKPSSNRSDCFLIIFNYDFLHTTDIYITYGPCTTYSTYIRELKKPRRRRRQQNPRIFAYLKNSIIARFARSFFIF